MLGTTKAIDRQQSASGELLTAGRGRRASPRTTRLRRRRRIDRLDRDGADQDVHVSGNEVVVLMAVANETSSTIVLSNSRGRIVGFEANPMPTVRFTSGVSVKIPVVIRRVERRDASGNVADWRLTGSQDCAQEQERARDSDAPGEAVLSARR